MVIPVYNKWEYTFRCLMALAHQTRDVDHEVIVIDNASTDETAQALPMLDKLRVLRNPDNFGFARACNQGAAMARGRYLVFLNNDTEPRAGWLSAMVRVADADPDVAIVGNQLLFPDGTIQHAGVIFGYGVPFPITPFHAHYRRPPEAADTRAELRAVTAACMLIRPQVFSAVGGFDEGYVNGYEDVDLCLKVGRAGGRIVYTPDSVVVHHESVSEGRFASDGANVDRLNQRWLDDVTGFEVDVRTEIAAAPPAPPAAHPPTSIVVPLRDALLTLVPCIESVLRTTGPADEILLINDGATGASARIAARFAAQHPGRVRLFCNPRPLGFPAAVAQGLASARHARAVVMAPCVRVVGDWLARMEGHLGAAPGMGALVPTLLPVQHLRLKELLYPVGATAGDPAPPRGSPGQGIEKVELAAAPLIYGGRDRLCAVGRVAPNALCGGEAAALAAALEGMGLQLGRAGDVGVYRLAQLAGDADARLATRYLAQQSANLAYERAFQKMAQAPVGMLTGAQTDLCSLVLVADSGALAAATALDAIYRHTQRSLEVILVDCLGDDRLRAHALSLARDRGHLAYLPGVAGAGWAAAFNQGLAAARGEYLAVLRDDVRVTPGWLARLLALMALDPSVALVGPAIANSGSGRGSAHEAGAQDAGMRTYREGPDLAEELPHYAESWALAHQGEHAIVSPLSGACLVMRRRVLARVGGFDARPDAQTPADRDFCARAARAGFRMAIAFDVLVHRVRARVQRAGTGRAASIAVAPPPMAGAAGHP